MVILGLYVISLDQYEKSNEYVYHTLLVWIEPKKNISIDDVLITYLQI